MFGLQTSSGHQMLGVHHSAMTTVHFGKIARKHGLTGVCLDLLSRYVALRGLTGVCLDLLSRYVALPHHPGPASSRLSHLHWLPVHRRIQYKITLLTYKSLSTNQPPYLRNLLHMYQPMRCLRSASQNLLTIPFCTTDFSKRSFSFSAPTIWNELPAAIRESNTLDTFKCRLKTHLTSLTTRIE